VLRHAAVEACRPCFCNQSGNARYVERGVLERGGVEAAVRRLMTERDGDEMRARAAEMKDACLAMWPLITGRAHDVPVIKNGFVVWFRTSDMLDYCQNW
jgi:hypothetical protein